MQIATQMFAQTVLASPLGSIDHSTAAAFEAALLPLLDRACASRSGVVLDFAGVDYISSVGLRVLMIAAKQMREHQAPLVIAAAQPVVAEIFTISRFNKVLTLVATLDEALALCAAASS